MSGIIDIVRRVVEEELVRTRVSLLGVVTAVFPHEAADDENNYEVGVKLKHDGLELRRVPLAVPHVGVAAPPRAGDLVLVQFVNGDLNQPVVVGRFYHAKERPPLHKEDEVLFEHRMSDGTLNHLRFAADGSIFLQRDVTKPEDNSKAKTSIRIDGASGDLEIKVGDDVVLQMKSDKISIKGDMEIEGNVKMKGDLEVSNGSNKTTISGNSIEGA
jgi:phage baseplate assembly protein gpV